MEPNEFLKAYLTAKAIEKFSVEDFEESLKGVHDEAVKNALRRLEKLSEVRSWLACIDTEIVSMEQYTIVGPILEKIAEEKKILDKMK